MDYKQALLDAGIKMVNSGLTVGTWGNISIRDPETNLVYLTPSGMPYDSIAKEDVVVMDLDGNVVDGFRKPTIEWGMHLGVMKARKDVNAIVHTHPIYSQVFSLLHEDIPPVIDEAAQLLYGNVKCTEYALPGSEKLATEVAEKLDQGAACLIANHGAVCVGSDIDMAFKVCTVLEMTSQIYYMARCIGNPQPENPNDVAFMHDFVMNKYGQGK